MKKYISILLVAALMLGTIGFLPASAETYTEDELSINWLEKDYTLVGTFHSGLAIVRYDGKEGYINIEGKEVIPCIYDKVTSFGKNYATVYKDGQTILIDKVGNEKNVGDYDQISNVGGNLFCAINNREGHEATLLDINGNIIIGPGKYSDFWYATGDIIYAFVKPEKSFVAKYGLITSKGEELLPSKYDFMSSFKEGLIAVGTYEGEKIKYGYADKNGKFVISPQFYYEGISFPFDGDFYKGKAIVRDINGVQFVIDKTGRKLEGVSPQSIEKASNEYLDYLEPFSDNKTGKSGYRTAKDGIIIPAIFDEARFFVDDVTSVKKGDKYGILINPKTQNNSKVTALVSPQKLTVNNVEIKNLEVYNINGHNYFKLRDIAKLASKTKTKFSINWDGEKKLIFLVKGENYKELGTELKPGDNKNKTGIKSTARLKLNGESIELSAYNIENQNYYEIRPLGKALGFEVDYNSATKTIELTM